jgi:hypothetical protein
VAQQPAADQAAAQALRAEIDQLKNEFSTRLTALEAKLAAIAGETTAAPAAAAGQPAAQPTVAVPPGAEGAGGPSGSLPVYGNVSAGSRTST